jgi:hypothetical protein
MSYRVDVVVVVMSGRDRLSLVPFGQSVGVLKHEWATYLEAGRWVHRFPAILPNHGSQWLSPLYVVVVRRRRR